jgi:hypothetical protein
MTITLGVIIGITGWELAWGAARLFVRCFTARVRRVINGT